MIPKIKHRPTIKRLTWDEMQIQRSQGLCFNYLEKFTPRHQCKGPQLLLLEGIHEDLDGDVDNKSLDYQSKISLHALSGRTNHNTIQVMEKIGSYQVLVLIDSGSTHHFIS